MALERVVVLVGGVGGAKLAHGLAKAVKPERLTVIVNTGDDFWLHSLRISPDFDTVMYTLGGVVDPTNGWGIANDTTAALDALRHYGEEGWFRLGDRDLATHLMRTDALRRGERLTTVAGRLKSAYGIGPRLLPMTDDEAPTLVKTTDAEVLEFQVYFVRRRWQPVIETIDLSAAGRALMTPEVCDAILQADVILIAPSNPWLSIAPILAMPDMRALLLSRDIPRVAVTPIVGGSAIKGPAAKIMRELGLEVSARSVAEYYGQIINGFVYDLRDEQHPPALDRVLMTDTIMKTDDDRARLAAEMLKWIEGW